MSVNFQPLRRFDQDVHDAGRWHALGDELVHGGDGAGDLRSLCLPQDKAAVDHVGVHVLGKALVDRIGQGNQLAAQFGYEGLGVRG